jgi:endonuclease-8
MPEGDTLRRMAATLAEVLVGREVTRARGRAGGPALGRVVGSRVERVESVGKHLLIGFGSGQTLHTHLRMRGSWHRYRPNERWQRMPDRAVVVLEVPGAVAVCFDAPTVEFLDSRAVRIHPRLAALGPDLVEPSPDLGAAFRRLRAPELAASPVGEALIDQTVVAGLGNVYRSEVCFIERVDPFAPVGSFDDGTLRRLLLTASRLLRANLRGPRTTMPDLLGGPVESDGPRGARRLWVYRRAGRPCRRCGTTIRVARGGALQRSIYWCPKCQRLGLAPDIG